MDSSEIPEIQFVQNWICGSHQGWQTRAVDQILHTTCFGHNVLLEYHTPHVYGYICARTEQLGIYNLKSLKCLLLGPPQGKKKIS